MIDMIKKANLVAALLVFFILLAIFVFVLMAPEESVACDPNGYKDISWAEISFELPDCWEIKEQDREDRDSKFFAQEGSPSSSSFISIRIDLYENDRYGGEYVADYEVIQFGDNTFINVNESNDELFLFYLLPTDEDATYYNIGFESTLSDEVMERILASFVY